VQALLLDLRAAALDQDNQHDDEKHAGNNPDNHGLVHIESPFSLDNKFGVTLNVSRIRITPAAEAAMLPDRGCDAWAAMPGLRCGPAICDRTAFPAFLLCRST
jgi:hypothetical protein